MTDAESTVASDEEAEKLEDDEEPLSDDDELTEIGSTCSGFTDISSLADLDIPDFPKVEGTIDAGMDSETDQEVR